MSAREELIERLIEGSTLVELAESLMVESLRRPNFTPGERAQSVAASAKRVGRRFHRTFDASKHPRDNHGRFAKRGGGSARPPQTVSRSPREEARAKIGGPPPSGGKTDLGALLLLKFDKDEVSFKHPGGTAVVHRDVYNAQRALAMHSVGLRKLSREQQWRLNQLIEEMDPKRKSDVLYNRMLRLLAVEARSKR